MVDWDAGDICEIHDYPDECDCEDALDESDEEDDDVLIVLFLDELV